MFGESGNFHLQHGDLTPQLVRMFMSKILKPKERAILEIKFLTMLPNQTQGARR